MTEYLEPEIWEGRNLSGEVQMAQRVSASKGEEPGEDPGQGCGDGLE